MTNEFENNFRIKEYQSNNEQINPDKHIKTYIYSNVAMERNIINIVM